MFLAPRLQSDSQEPFGFPLVRGIEEGAHLGGHRFSGLLASDELSGVLLQVERAALPGHRRQNRPAGGFEPRVIVGDDELDALQATGQKIFQKAPQLISASKVATSQPSTRRSPEASIPTAIKTAQSTILPASRTFS
jgi:hypothetical protein